jgi:hypothetical protein
MSEFLYEKRVDSDKQLEQELRSLINNWAAKTPHHPYKNLGSEIKIEAIWYKPAYPIHIQSQFEERSKGQDHEPFRNQEIPEQRFYNTSDFNAWDIELPDLSGFKNESKKFYVEGSQHVENCHTCTARGWITCLQCHGETTVTCPRCSGRGKVNCSSCGGTGKRNCGTCGGSGYTSRQVQRSRQVWVPGTSSSGGYYKTEYYTETVRDRCSNCGGTGKKTCSTCSGTGKVSCGTCLGNGYITCPRCGGTGRNTCPTCEGETQLMHYLYVQRDLSTMDKQSCIIHSEVFDRFPQYLDEYQNYSSKSIYKRKDQHLSEDIISEETHLNTFINDFLAKHHEAEKPDHILQYEQIEVSRIETWELYYSFKGKSYAMVFIGDEKELIPGESPISDVAFELWHDGVQAAKVMRNATALSKLKKAKDINTYEVEEQINEAVEKVIQKVNQGYRSGSMLGLLLLLFPGIFIFYNYYSQINYVLPFVSFVNNPDHFLFDFHTWSQTLMSLLLVFGARSTSNNILTRLENKIPSVILRFTIAFIFTVFLGFIYTGIWAGLNVIGITLIITFIVWLAYWVIKIILIILGLAIGLIIWLAKIIWGILSWIYGLFF